MALNIKSTETERLAREVAELTGDTITEAVRKALELRLAQARAERDVEIARKRQLVGRVQDNVARKLAGRTVAVGTKDFDRLWDERREDEG
jgi:antitoxin VapB